MSHAANIGLSESQPSNSGGCSTVSDEAGFWWCLIGCLILGWILGMVSSVIIHSQFDDQKTIQSLVEKNQAMKVELSQYRRVMEMAHRKLSDSKP